MTLRFFIKALLVVVALIVIDISFGKGMRFLADHSKGGDTYNVNYINRHFADSLAVFGSSRASHHYDPETFEESLGVPTYNCGIDGNGILLAWCFLNNIIKQGEKPEVIVYDFFPRFDLYCNDDRQRALTHIKPYYDIDGMKDFINDFSDNEYAKLHLSTYRYNSAFIQVLSDAIAPRQQNIKGYKPYSGCITTDFVRSEEPVPPIIDSLKTKYLNKFIETCRSNDIRLVFVISPHFFESDTDYAGLLKKNADSEITIIDMSNSAPFPNNKSLFVDPSHLNNTGAELFSSMLADSLRQMLHMAPPHNR